MDRSLNTNDDSVDAVFSTTQMLSTLFISAGVFAALVLIFEGSRSIKCLYLNRFKTRFINSDRVPPKPSVWIPFAWIPIVLKITDNELLKMVGLDGYMLIRFLKICIRVSVFYSVLGLIILVPIYSSAGNGSDSWGRYTLTNVPPSTTENPSNQLWASVVMCYLFSAYFCQLMYYEYKNFIDKRIAYLSEKDFDTPDQTYYSIMIEKIPNEIKSTPVLYEFLEKIFPGDIYSIEVALHLQDLDKLVKERHSIRNNLEKAIAKATATNKRQLMKIKRDFYAGIPGPVPQEVETSYSNSYGFIVVDSIEHYMKVLQIMNESITTLQKMYYQQRQVLDESDGLRLNHITRVLESNSNKFVSNESMIESPLNTLITETADVQNEVISSENGANNDNNTKVEEEEEPLENSSQKNKRVSVKVVKNAITEATKSGIGTIVNEGMRSAKLATTGTFGAFFEATRTLELLTLGEHYKVSTTAFVTFNSRVSKCNAEQVLISNKYHQMQFISAPHPKNIIWDNIYITRNQSEARNNIVESIFIFGAVMWSVVVTFITAISNLDSISETIPSIKQYSNTEFYKIVNNYLALGLLCIILATIPYLFDFSARHYEGFKLESDIQNSIMSRYFYYSMANVYVALGLGSILSSINSIYNNPQAFFNILGNSIPSFSLYFTSFVIIKMFTGIPLELLRIFPLIDILRVSACTNKKTVTRREMRTGAFADPPILYGWVYPNLLMIFTIMSTYSCISPLLTPFCLCFFVLAYLMYKYQLLYVYINESQSGGFMWYAVFDRSMVALLGGVVTLLCYLLIRQTYNTGPFYVLIPLPLIIALFWHRTDKAFKLPAMSLSLSSSVELDFDAENKRKDGLTTPQQTFSPTLYRQPSLVEGALKPEQYRNKHVNRNTENIIDRYSITSMENNSIIVENKCAYEGEENPEIENQIDELLGEGENFGGKEGSLHTPLRNYTYNYYI